MVSADGIQPQPDKLAAIRDWPTPHCLRDVRAFYGLASYYRKFVKDFARIAEPLSRTTKKNTPFMWTDETQQSFEELKKALLDVDTLAYPTPGIPTSYYWYWMRQDIIRWYRQSQRCARTTTTSTRSTTEDTCWCSHEPGNHGHPLRSTYC